MMTNNHSSGNGMEAINLNRLAYFSAVVEAGSFTRAAARLGITKTVVSQQVARLEAELKTSLLARTTRRVEPTEAGRLLHARCVLIFREAEDVLAELAQTNAEPMGVLRVAATNDFGACTIARVAAAFCQKYPACRVELILADTRMDLVANQIDVAIRTGWLDDSSQQARRIGSFRQLLVASPARADVETATAPADLAALPFIANTALKDPLTWEFVRGEETLAIRFQPNLAINSTPAVLSSTIAGGGLSVLPDFLVAADIKAGRLMHVLPEWSLPAGGIHAVYPAARFRPPKVTSFVSLLAEVAGKQGDD
jgi:DNA-binding transcriptional LysR family regulator